MKSKNLFFSFSSISILVHLDLNIIIISVSCGVIYVMLQLTVSPALSQKEAHIHCQVLPHILPSLGLQECFC